MPRRRRVDIGRCTRDAKRTRLLRSNETDQEREIRLAKTRERVALKRLRESPIERNNRLFADRIRQINLRAGRRNLVISCCAPNCVMRHFKGCDISFHRFPTDPEMRQKWIDAIGRKNFNPSKHVALCSKHFKPEDYVTCFGVTKLKVNVVPTQFESLYGKNNKINFKPIKQLIKPGEFSMIPSNNDTNLIDRTDELNPFEMVLCPIKSEEFQEVEYVHTGFIKEENYSSFLTTSEDSSIGQDVDLHTNSFGDDKIETNEFIKGEKDMSTFPSPENLSCEPDMVVCPNDIEEFNGVKTVGDIQFVGIESNSSMFSTKTFLPTKITSHSRKNEEFTEVEKTTKSGYLKWCFVPGCQSTSLKTPNKIFFYVPTDMKKKAAWFKAARRDLPMSKSKFLCCEDHFNLEEDMENYIRYKLIGGMVKFKKGVVPHIFDCQKGKKGDISTPKSAFHKRRRKEIIKEN